MWHTKITRINWQNKFLFFIEDARVTFLSSSDLGHLILRFGTHFICIQSHFSRRFLPVDTLFDTYLDSATHNLQVFEDGDNFFSTNQSLITSIVSSSDLGLCMSNGFLISVQLYLPLSRGSYSRLTFWVRRRTCLGTPPLNGKNPLKHFWQRP